MEEKQSVSSNVTNSSFYQKMTCSSSKTNVQQNSPMGQFSLKKKKNLRDKLCIPILTQLVPIIRIYIVEEEIRRSCQEGLTCLCIGDVPAAAKSHMHHE